LKDPYASEAMHLIWFKTDW